MSSSEDFSHFAMIHIGYIGVNNWDFETLPDFDFVAAMFYKQMYCFIFVALHSEQLKLTPSNDIKHDIHSMKLINDKASTHSYRLPFSFFFNIISLVCASWSYG